MEKKTLAFIIGALLIGIVLGVTLMYFMAPSTGTRQRQIDDLQNQITQKNNQIQSLQNQVQELQVLLGPIKKGDWNLIKSFNGSSGFTTDYFYIAGTDLRINWTWSSSAEEYASFSIYLYKEGQSIYTEAFINLQNSGTTFAHNVKASYYYLQILEANINYWTITIEAWTPK